MLIIAGHLQVEPEQRETYLAAASSASRLARESPGCAEFVQAPDPLVPGRIVIFERWDSEADLLTFRDGPPPADAPQLPDVLDADVRRYKIASVGPA